MKSKIKNQGLVKIDRIQCDNRQIHEDSKTLKKAFNLPQNENIEKKFKTAEINNDLAVFQTLFENEDNPLFAWKALMLCKENKIEIPEWIIDYFYSCASKLTSIKDTADDRAEISISKALDLRKSKCGRGTKVTVYHDCQRKLKASRRVLEIHSQGKTLAEAYEIVGKEMNASEKTIEKWFYWYRDIS